ncbi:Major facilitator superfamily transporter multidrug resistance [Pleurostoma richardsiae]|uniref:Major facilitator superfamily transporter multidrug resistance n=1 Tax=Pleurostoma richardsiae TaxID=41990 RepID=A0AA38RSC1_9PEZI|nr:Major facilitator superfamily transporter multidrug resistance [Pleurostoma richardsiae]
MTLDESARRRPDFPVRQLAILLTCRLVEPLAISSIIPYLFSMVKFASPNLSDTEATRYVTLVFSVYSFAQFGTNIIWGRISDRIGRRPVMLFGLVGILASTIAFAFSTSVSSIFVSRIAAGLLSGNIVITRTMIGDMVHGRENKARAFAWNQTAYQIGTVVGPIIGGYLVEPCTQFPSICSRGRMALFEAYPFALPNIIIAGLIATSLVVAYFFMEESLVMKSPSDPAISEDSSLLQPDQATKTSATVSVLEPRVIHVVVSYGFMALHTICFDQIFPAFLATSAAESKMPFKLNGGLNMSSATVASFISASGILSIALMITIFPPVDTYFGSLPCMRASLVLYPIIYALLPDLAALPDTPAWIRLGCVALLLGAKTLASVFAFNDNAILLNVVTPSPNALGLINGVAQTAAAGARAMGPALMGVFIGLGERVGTGALGWWFLAVVAAVGVIQGLWVSDDGEEEDET